MGLLFPDPPTPPNPFLTAGLQTASNINTAVGSAYLSNVNQVTPQGNLTYSAGTPYSWTDPTGVTWNVPTFTSTQTNPAWTTQYDPAYGTNYETNQQKIQEYLAQTGKVRALSLMNMPTFDPLTGAPAAGDPASLMSGLPTTQYGWADVGDQQRSLGPYAAQQTQLANTGQQQYGFGDGGAITRSYGPADNFSADRQRVEGALFERMNPQLLQDEERLRQQLADQGIKYGTPAYDNAMRNLTSQRTDARLAVTAAGGQEQQRMADMAAQRAGFENAAQQQAFGQAMQRGQFANQAQAEAYKQALATGQFANQAQIEQFQKDLQAGNFANQAQKDAFTQAASRTQFANAAQAQELANRSAQMNAQNAARAQYLQEQWASRQQPINEITALQSGSQLSSPNFSTYNNQIANTDVAGIINNRFSQDMDIYKQQNANVNNIIGGLFGLAGSGAKAGAQIYTGSDRRMKEDVHRVGTVYAARRHDEGAKKLPIYEYAYKDDPSSTRHVGPMAQDVEQIDPGAVREFGGRKYINKPRVMGDILKVA